MDFQGYAHITQVAEAAKFDCIFFQDTVGVSGSRALARGFFGQVHELGDALDGLLLAIEENDGLAIGGGDLLEGAPQDSLLLFADGLRVGSGDRGGDVRAVVQGCSAGHGIADLAAEGGVDEVAQDAIQPGAELGGLFEIAQLAPGEDEGFLREVLAAGDVAAGAVGEGADGGLIACDELAKGIAIASEAELYEAGVIQGVGCGIHARLGSGRKRGNVTGNLRGALLGSLGLVRERRAKQLRNADGRVRNARG